MCYSSAARDFIIVQIYTARLSTKKFLGKIKIACGFRKTCSSQWHNQTYLERENASATKRLYHEALQGARGQQSQMIAKLPFEKYEKIVFLSTDFNRFIGINISFLKMKKKLRRFIKIQTC